jgi:exodeoxyribonuclease X
MGRVDRMVIRVIDLESTGVDPATDAIIEIASVDLIKGGGITNAMQTFVNPGRPIPPAASAIHHLVDEDVRDAPTLADAIVNFAGADAYVSHNADFEQSFLKAAGIEFGRPWICTYKCALRIWPELDGHGNQFLRYHLGLSAPFNIHRHKIIPHRAASDVIVTAAIFEHLLALAPWSDLVDWSSLPALHTRMPFGKHKGMRFDKIDADYIDWLLRQKEMDASIKFSAQHWLDLREKPV